MAQKPSPEPTQPIAIEEGQILPAGAPRQPPPTPRGQDVSGWLRRPLGAHEFAPGGPAVRRGRRWWLLVGLVVLAILVMGGAAVTRLVISRTSPNVTR